MSAPPAAQAPVQQQVLVYTKRKTILPKKNQKQPKIPITSWIVLALVVGGIVAVFWFFHGVVVQAWVRWSMTIIWVLANLGLGIYDFVIPKKPNTGGTTDSTPIDRWTLAHTGSGIILGIWYFPLWAVLALTIIWEVFETKVVGFGDKEIIKNRLVDIGVAVVGWALIVITIMGTTVPEAPFPLLTAPR
jgi:hypothetical protein